MLRMMPEALVSQCQAPATQELFAPLVTLQILLSHIDLIFSLVSYLSQFAAVIKSCHSAGLKLGFLTGKRGQQYLSCQLFVRFKGTQV